MAMHNSNNQNLSLFDGVEQRVWENSRELPSNVLFYFGPKLWIFAYTFKSRINAFNETLAQGRLYRVVVRYRIQKLKPSPWM